MKKSIITCLIALCSLPSAALTTFGKPDCGQWFSLPDSAKPWLMGFMSGLNVTADEKIYHDTLNKLHSAEQAYLFMDKYCKQFPLKDVAEGGFQLFFELTKLKN